MSETAETIKFDERGLVIFKDGIYGFENRKKFLPLEVEEGSDAIVVFKNMEEDDLEFVTMNPFMLGCDYNPVLSSDDFKRLGTDKMEDLSFYVITVVKENVGESTVNLKCPLVINAKTREGIQAVLEDSRYTLRHRLCDLSDGNDGK